MKFQDVRNCKTTEEFNEFVRKYIDEWNLEGEEKRKTYWALFYEWKESNSPEKANASS